MNNTDAWNYGLSKLIDVMIKRSGELQGERLAGFMFAVRLVQVFRLS